MSGVDGGGSGVPAEAADAGGEEVRGTGESADGQVRAVVAGGRVAAVGLEPRQMRRPAGDLARHLTAAINAAFDDFRAKARAADGVAVDPVAFAEGFAGFHDQAVRVMGMISQAITGAMDQLRESTGVRGDPSPKGLEHLLEQTRGVVDAVRGAGEDEAEEEAAGEGSAADGRVRVQVALAGPVAALEIDQRAMRAGSQALVGQVAEAVNAALDDLQARAREQARAARVDPESLRALREASTEQMAAYTRSLRDLMSSIEPR